ncbi:MAG TPA: putative sulfate exporter family transporter [Thermodesulfovibrionales bacterium]|nr:putative sulfate exporter family transporter [Thermodesulfovibrionales bacterium]
MEEKRMDEDKLTEAKCDTVETCAVLKKPGISEDWLSLWLGLFIFILSLGVFGGVDILGWGVSNKVWTDPAKTLAPVSKNYQGVKGEITKIEGQKLTLKKADGKEETITVTEDASGLKVGDKYEKKGMAGIVSLLLTYLAMLIIMGIGAKALGANVGKFAIGFTIVFWIGYLCWLIGHYAYIAATTPKDLATFGIPWALKLTGEAGFIVALIVGLIVGNFFPRFAEILKEATRPELYIKTAIVIMGAGLGVKAAESLGLASAVMFRGLCAIVEAYLIYWALVYFIARKFFKFSREWSAPLASGISICGVSAAIATGGAIRARPVVPIMVSSLVVIFAVVELVLLPFLAREFLWQEPLVAGAWMGLAVKTDGAAVASGAVTDSLIRAKAEVMEGVKYKEGWMIMTATTVKMFIDIFIGIWAFILAIIWCAKIECKEGQKVRAIEIWHRFPKFVIGYALTFFLLLLICLPASSSITPVDKEINSLKQEISAAEKKLPTAIDPAAQAALGKTIKAKKARIAELSDQIKKPKATMAAANTATAEGNTFRVIFFVLTFFTIGVVSNFKKLWEEGIGKLAAVYLLCLFGFIIWIGLVISWIFFHGVKPPIVTG